MASRDQRFPEEQAIEIIASITPHFAELHDPRVNRRRRYDLPTIIVLALLATICGCDGWDQIEEFVETRADVLRTLFDLSKGLPSDDTFRRVFAALDPSALGRSVFAWLSALVGSTEGKTIALDGKTLRRSFDRAFAQLPLHLVHAWVVEDRVLIGQAAVEQKSNEITATADLLAMLDLRRALVTGDAAFCQHKNVETITAAGGDYLIAVKENQPRLHQAIVEHFARHENDARVNTVETTNRGHGRAEYRRVRVSGSLRDLPLARDWKGCKSVVCVDRGRVDGLNISAQRVYYLSSVVARQAPRIATAVRAHWSVENTLHWSLDMTFREDESRIRDRNAAHNLALVRRIALSLLKNEPTRKTSLPLKRIRAAGRFDYAISVLLSKPS